MTALTTHAPVLLIALPLLGAFATPLIGKLGRGARNTLIGLIVLFVAGLAALLAVDVFGAGGIPTVYELGGGTFTFPLSGGQVPVRILFEVDGMSAFMGLITALIALTGAFFSFSYWKERSGGNLYFSLFLLLTAGIFGMVLTGDMFNFFVFLEITSIAAASLVGFRVWLKQSQEAGFKVMAMYTLSGLFVLLAIGLLYGQYGHLNIAALANSITGSLTDMVALGLLLTGLAMKAGAVPMHMWAPDAYGEAPAPVSAILVANSQASLYGLFRILFTMFGVTVSTSALGWILIVLALLTIFVGVTMALIQNATKPEYGLVAMQGGIFHMLNDAACVGLLFFASGAVIRAAGTRDLNRMGGLGHQMKWTSIFFAIGAVALAGVPPFNGFASKFLIYEAAFKLSPFLAVIAVLSSIMLLAVFVKAFQAAFLGPRSNASAHVSDPSLGMMLPMAALVLVVIVFGLFPGFFVDHIVTPAAKALWLGRDAYINAVLGG